MIYIQGMLKGSPDKLAIHCYCKYLSISMMFLLQFEVMKIQAFILQQKRRRFCHTRLLAWQQSVDRSEKVMKSCEAYLSNFKQFCSKNM